MKRLKSLALACTALACMFTSLAEAAIIRFDIAPAFAPNSSSSSSFNGWAANALTAMQSSSIANISDRNAPTNDATAFELVDSANPTSPANLINPSEMIVTSFNSWRGVAPPASPFGAELGNRVHFPFALETDSNMKIDIANLDINWTKHWMDNDAAMATSTIIQDPLTSGTFSTASYTDLTIGVDFGGDGALGGGDDTILTSGTGAVDAIYSVGVGDGFLVDEIAGATDQEEIDAFVSNLLASDHTPQKLKTTYTVTLDSNEQLMSMSTIFLVPEPVSLVTMLPGIGILVAYLRRRRNQ